MELVPVTLTEARLFVNQHHSHNEAPTSWRFGVGLAVDGALVGVAMAGRCTGRGFDQYRDLEVTRVCVGDIATHQNACSRLYGAVCRAATALGYRHGVHVHPAGFVLDADLEDRGDDRTWATSRPRYEETLLGPRKVPGGPKRRWRRDLAVSVRTP